MLVLGLKLALPLFFSAHKVVLSIPDYSSEAIEPKNVCDFLVKNKELAGHIIINAQIFKIRPLDQMIRKDRELD